MGIMAGLMILGAEGAILIRDLARGRRDTMAWAALIVAGVLFLPYLPYAIGQSQQMIHGQWLDYLGPAHNYSLAAKVAVAMVAALPTLWLVFGRAVERNNGEPIRVLIAWIGLPALAFIVGSVILHPMLNPRYLAPGIAASSLLIAAALGALSVKWRNLLAAGFVVACLIMLPFDRSKPQPWRDFAEQVTAGGASGSGLLRSGIYLERKHRQRPQRRLSIRLLLGAVQLLLQGNQSARSDSGIRSRVRANDYRAAGVIGGRRMAHQLEEWRRGELRAARSSAVQGDGKIPRRSPGVLSDHTDRQMT